MSLNSEERNAVVTYRLEKAAKTYEQARANVSMGFWELIANRLYYAAYYAVSALLIANKHTARTHEGIIRIFGLYFVKTNRVPIEYGKLYNKLFTLRLTGDYNDHYNLTEQDVIPLVEPTRQLIEDISLMVSETIRETKE